LIAQAQAKHRPASLYFEYMLLPVKAQPMRGNSGMSFLIKFRRRPSHHPKSFRNDMSDSA